MWPLGTCPCSFIYTFIGSAPSGVQWKYHICTHGQQLIITHCRAWSLGQANSMQHLEIRQCLETAWRKVLEKHGTSLSHVVRAVCSVCAQVRTFSGCLGGSLIWDLLYCLQIVRDIFHGHEYEATWPSPNPSFPFRTEAWRASQRECQKKQCWFHIMGHLICPRVHRKTNILEMFRSGFYFCYVYIFIWKQRLPQVHRPDFGGL